MKELTREEWLQNQTPRVMWCWNVDSEPTREKVLYYQDKCAMPVVAVHNDNTIRYYKHCAVINRRQMTKRELTWWLEEHPEEHREMRIEMSTKRWHIFHTFDYDEADENSPFSVQVQIRSNGGEWHDAFIEEPFKCQK